MDKDSLKNIDIYINIDMASPENIDIDKDILKNIDIDIDKGILQNIDIDKILYRFEFGISNSTTLNIVYIFKGLVPDLLGKLVQS